MRSLSIKECFLKEELVSHNFEIKKLCNEETKKEIQRFFIRDSVLSRKK